MKKILVYFLLVTAYCYTQELSYIHLTEKDGLPDVEFYDIHRDNEGYIWLAADLGIFKYDGKKFHNYTHPQKRGLSLFNIYEDEDGRIWCNNISGQIFYIVDNQMYLFSDEQNKKHGNLIDILVKDSKVYITNPYIVRIYDFTSKRLIESQDKTLFDSPLVAFNDKVLLVRDSTLLELKSDFSKRTLLNDTSLKSYSYVNQFFITNKEVFVYRGLDTNEFLRLESDKDSLTSIKIPEVLKNRRWSKIQEIGENIWFSTDKGIFKCSITNNEISILDIHLENSYTTGIARDINQNYWITTLDNGVYVIPNLGIELVNKKMDTSKVIALSTYKNNELLFGYLDGSIKSFRPQSNDFKHILSNTSKFSELFYISSEDVILSCNDLSSSAIKNKISYPIANLSSIKDIVTVADDTLLVAAYNQTVLVDISDLSQITKIKRLHQERSYTVHYDPNSGSYYSGTVSNLKLYDQSYKEKIIKLYDQDIFAIDIVQTNNGVVWVSTFNQGVLGIKNEQVIVVLDKSKGLPSSRSSKLFADQNYLWITTDKGIARVDVENYDVKILTTLDGIPSYKVYDVVKGNNKLYVASNEGVFTINIDQSFIERPAPNIEIEEVLVNGNVVDWKEKELKIPILHNDITINLSSNGFQTDQSIFYEYRFNDDESWNTLEQGDDDLSFLNLADQEYRLKIRATNRFSGLSSEVKKINFTIVLPFYEQMWFILMMSLLGIIAGILYVRHYFNRKKILQDEKYSRLHLENQLNALKLENLRSQMNPHFIFNAFNSIQDYILRNKREEASDYLGKFADLVRGYLYSSTDDKIAFHKEIENLEHYLDLEKLRFEDNFMYTIKIDNKINQYHFYIPTMLIQPFLENAVKHGLLHKSGVKKIELLFSLIMEGDLDDDDMILSCSIKDNGIGRASSKAMKNVSSSHRSFGVIATEKRLELLNNNLKEKVNLQILDLYSVDGTPEGTEVKLKIPVFWEK